MTHQQTHLLRVCLLGVRREVEPEQVVVQALRGNSVKLPHKAFQSALVGVDALDTVTALLGRIGVHHHAIESIPAPASRIKSSSLSCGTQKREAMNPVVSTPVKNCPCCLRSAFGIPPTYCCVVFAICCRNAPIPTGNSSKMTFSCQDIGIAPRQTHLKMRLPMYNTHDGPKQSRSSCLCTMLDVRSQL